MSGLDAPDERPVERVLFGDLRPGETPIDDFTGLRVPNITTLRELSLHEANNIADAVTDYLRQEGRKHATFDIEGAKAVHAAMFRDVWDWAGCFRQVDINIQFASRYAQIQENVYNLFDDLKAWQSSGADEIEQVALLHHRAVQIHPFVNGNGRWSRMLANILLLERLGTLINWPHEIGELSPIRSEYMRLLAQHHQCTNGSEATASREI